MEYNLAYDLVSMAVYVVLTALMTGFCLFYFTKKARLGIGTYIILFVTYFICFFALFLCAVDISVVCSTFLMRFVHHQLTLPPSPPLFPAQCTGPHRES